MYMIVKNIMDDGDDLLLHWNVLESKSGREDEVLVGGG